MKIEDRTQDKFSNFRIRISWLILLKNVFYSKIERKNDFN